jgi:hypothetical protein
MTSSHSMFHMCDACADLSPSLPSQASAELVSVQERPDIEIPQHPVSPALCHHG